MNIRAENIRVLFLVSTADCLDVVGAGGLTGRLGFAGRALSSRLITKSFSKSISSSLVKSLDGLKDGGGTSGRGGGWRPGTAGTGCRNSGIPAGRGDGGGKFSPGNLSISMLDKSKRSIVFSFLPTFRLLLSSSSWKL